MMQPEIEEIIVFTVPYLIPTSVNHYWDNCTYKGRDGYLHQGRKLSPEAKAFKDAVAIFAQGRSVAPATERERKRAQYRVEIDVYLGHKQRGDADNFNKGCLDSLQYAGVIDTDSKVRTCQITVHKDERENPRTQFIVERLNEPK